MKKTFFDVLHDIETGLIGIELHSISGSASTFSIVEVDYANDNVVLDVQGKRKTWTFERLEKVWNVLYYRPAANVEVVFGGSGSSRNQVETIYASLPYIEWLYIKAKKCIAYVGEPSHEYGTLRHMDEDKEQELSTLMEKPNAYNLLLEPDEIQELNSETGQRPLNYNTSVSIDRGYNRIIFGAPGTGKSYLLNSDKNVTLAHTTGTFERVTFHPEYSYSQFVGCYKPLTDSDGSIRYEFIPGPFMRVLVSALKSGRSETPQPHILLIEEINRAKVAAVFGEVFQLLDRNDDGYSQYEIHATEDVKHFLAQSLGGASDDYTSIRIPNNMFIWATMNSADQGVFPMDTAFKRRWDFEYIGIDDNDATVGGLVEIGKDAHKQLIDWNILRKSINEKLAVEFHVNEDKLMGPFFLGKSVFDYDTDTKQMKNPDAFKKAFKSKVLMYLYEDAAKPCKHQLFSGCDSSRYSSVCTAFDETGFEIFGTDFQALYDRIKGA